MKIYKSFNEMAEGTGALSPNADVMAFVDNMSPAILEYGNMKFYPGLEDPKKRKHVHVRSPEGKIKIWLEPEVEYDSRGTEGEFKSEDVRKAVEQVKEHCDEFKKDIDKAFAGEKLQKQKGYKIKGKNRKK